MVYRPRLDHIPPLEGGSIGPTAGFAEVAGTAFNRAFTLDSAFGMQFDVMDQLNESIVAANRLTGQNVTAGFSNSLLGLSAWMQRRDGSSPVANAIIPLVLQRKYLADLDELDKQLEAISRDYASPNEPRVNVKSLTRIYEEELRRRKELARTAAWVDERASAITSVAGGLVGGLAGSFTIRDPLLLAAGLIPIGRGVSATRTLLLEGLAGGGTEFIQQQAFVRPRQRALGEPETNILASILIAAIGSAAFRGALEGATPAWRSLERKLFPRRAEERFVRQQFEAMLGKEAADSLDLQATTDLDALLEAVNRLRPSQETRTLQALVNLDAAAARVSPYTVSTREGRLVLETELERELVEFEGGVRADTAVGRIPNPEAPRVIISARTAEELLARTERPELFTRYDELQSTIDDSKARIAELQEILDRRTLSDAVAAIDEDVGNRVRQVETELRQPDLPKAREAELSRELDETVKRLGFRNIDKAEVAATTPIKRIIKQLRGNVARAQRSQQEVAAELGSVAESLRPAARQAPVEPANPRTDPAAEMREMEAAEQSGVREQLVESAIAARGKANEPVTIPGIEGEIDPEVRVQTEEGEISVRQAMEEMADDKIMREAAIKCGLKP